MHRKRITKASRRSLSWGQTWHITVYMTFPHSLPHPRPLSCSCLSGAKQRPGSRPPCSSQRRPYLDLDIESMGLCYSLTLSNANQILRSVRTPLRTAVPPQEKSKHRQASKPSLTWCFDASCPQTHLKCRNISAVTIYIYIFFFFSIALSRA